MPDYENNKLKKKTEAFTLVPAHYQDKSPVQYYIVEALCVVGGISVIIFGLAVIYGIVASILF